MFSNDKKFEMCVVNTCLLNQSGPDRCHDAICSSNLWNESHSNIVKMTYKNKMKGDSIQICEHVAFL